MVDYVIPTIGGISTTPEEMSLINMIFLTDLDCKDVSFVDMTVTEFYK